MAEHVSGGGGEVKAARTTKTVPIKNLDPKINAAAVYFPARLQLDADAQKMLHDAFKAMYPAFDADKIVPASGEVQLLFTVNALAQALHRQQVNPEDRPRVRWVTDLLEEVGE